MHEIGIIKSALELAQAEALRAGGSRIHLIRLRVGRLAGVEPEALSLAFEVARTGTVAEQAVLEVESVPVACWCQDCNTLFEPDSYYFICPQCEKNSADIRLGREIELASLEVS